MYARRRRRVGVLGRRVVRSDSEESSPRENGNGETSESLEISGEQEAEVKDEPDVRDMHLEEEDKTEQNFFAKGIKEAYTKLIEVAEVHLPTYVEAGPERKKEKNKTIKKYHDTAQDLVGVKLKCAMMPEIAKEVYKDLDIKRLASEEKDDEQFIKLLEEFEEGANNEFQRRSKTVTSQVIDEDPDYQECLESLNKFVDRGSKAPKAARKSKMSNGNGMFSDNESVASFSSPRSSNQHSEGLHALSEYIPTKDPITKKFFEDPYLNTICNHVYEYETMLGMIKTIGGIKCPYPGCANDEVITEDHLIKNLIMVKKIKERIQMEMSQDID